MKGKKKIASILACAMLLSAAPVEAMAYTVPDTVRVGLESVCKNVASASIGVWELQIGMQKGDGFQRGGVITSSGLFTARPAVGDYIAVDKTMDCADALDMANDMLWRLRQMKMQAAFPLRALRLRAAKPLCLCRRMPS